MHIGVDIMGGDSRPEELYDGVIDAIARLGASDSITVFVSAELAPSLPSHSQVHRVLTDEIITMEDNPLTAIRQKRKSSMMVGVRALREGEIEALVSAGNTGALVASATMVAKRLSGIDRPALLAVLPGGVAVLDVGGNVSVKSEQLVQFAQMGAAFQQCMKGVERPAVGLLNIGAESLKGTSEVREAYQRLKSSSGMNFVGNVEGRDVFQGKVDVLVTDGFSGNVFLKTAEGVSMAIVEKVIAKLNGASEALNDLRREVDYEEHPGAIVCGVDGIVVKCHGGSSARGMRNGILGTAELIRNDLLAKIKQRLR